MKLGKNLSFTFNKGFEVLNENKPKDEVLKTKIVERQLYRFNADIGKWRTALDAAESLYSPQRAELARVFQEVTLDSHLSALMQSRISKIMAHKYDLFDKEGEISEHSELLKKEWFTKVIKYVADSLFYGYTLIELDELEDFEFKSVCSLPRENIEPNKKLFKKEYYLTTGIPFLEEPFNNWTLYVEQEDNLGLLNKAAPLTIWKKNAVGSWGDYADMFGVPPRIGKTDVRDDKLRGNMESMLSNMGRLSYGVFDVEDTIELVESNTTDAYNVFMKLSEFCNSEMSKLIVGQTMTQDSGSSLSQSEVHERTLDSVIKADTNWIAAYINNKVIPFLTETHNFPFEGLEFKFDHTESLSLTEQMEMVKVLIPHKDVDNDWIIERFGIPVEDKATPTNPADAENFFFEQIADCYKKDKNHTCSGVDIVNELEPKPVLTKEEEDRLYELIFTGVITVDLLPSNLYLGTAEELTLAMEEGLGVSLKDFKPKTKEFKTIKALLKDIEKFSSNKTFQNVAEMQSFLRDENGDLKTFAKFKKEAGESFNKFNKNYLKTEFNTAFQNAQNAEKRQRMEDTKDVKPNAIYRTQGDSRVRDEHADLNGVVVEIGSAEMSAIDPQNDWGCRCFWESTSTPVPKKISSKINILNENENINPLFNYSTFDDKILFPPKHPYYNVPKKYKAKQKKNFGLPKLK
jgi:SPP1 gp7 family putative phage head morphogenesis protein